MCSEKVGLFVVLLTLCYTCDYVPVYKEIKQQDGLCATSLIPPPLGLLSSLEVQANPHLVLQALFQLVLCQRQSLLQDRNRLDGGREEGQEEEGDKEGKVSEKEEDKRKSMLEGAVQHQPDSNDYIVSVFVCVKRAACVFVCVFRQMLSAQHNQADYCSEICCLSQKTPEFLCLARILFCSPPHTVA